MICANKGRISPTMFLFALLASISMTLEQEETALAARISTPRSLECSVVNLRTSRAPGQDLYAPIPPAGSCTGLILDGQGHVVAPYSCLVNRYEIVATLCDRSDWPARYMGHDQDTGIAVLEVRAPGQVLSKVKPVIMGYGPGVRTGLEITAVAMPFGGWCLVKKGIVAARPRTVKLGEAVMENMLYVTVASSPLLNGALLADSSGRGIGMLISTKHGLDEKLGGLGLAVNAEMLQSVATRIITRGATPKPWIGAKFMDITPALATMFDLPAKRGVMVVETTPNGPAAKAGLHGSSKRVTVGNVRYPLGGDIIVGADGAKVSRLADLMEVVRPKAPGDHLTLTVIRKGKKKRVVLKLGRQPAPKH